jgi:serine/threonine-protein kinase
VVCPICHAENDPAVEHCFTCGHALATFITRGRVVASRYEILEPLGRGGMGVVYKVHDRMLDEPAALKILRPDLQGSAEAERRFRREIKLARKVRHKNVCAIHEYGDKDGLRFICMECVEGVDLREIIRKRGPLPVPEALEVAAQVADGLQAIHELGIVHRDLKTANIMRDAKGLVRLMDFGIAKLVDSHTLATASGSVVGTPEYMSPEQALGAKPDLRNDVYALGIVLFEILTGDVPFRADTPVATMMKHIHEPPPLDEPRARGIPQRVRHLLSHALAKDPAERLPSAEAATAALRQLRSELAVEPDHVAPRAAPRPAQRVSPQPETVLEPPRPQPPTGGQHRLARSLLLATVAAFLVAGAVGVGLLAGFWSPTQPAPETELVSGAEPPRADAESARDVAGALLTPPSGAPRQPDHTPAPHPEPSRRPQPTRARPGSKPAPEATPTESPTEVDSPRAEVRGPIRSDTEPERATPPATDAPQPAGSMTAPPSFPGPEPAVPAPSTSSPPPTTGPEPPEPTPSPDTPAPTPDPAAAEAPPPTSPPPPSPAPEPGLLRVVVTPWAEVLVDGIPRGTTPLPWLSLPAGRHVIQVRHPGFEPLERTVTILSGETEVLQVDLRTEAAPRE